MITNFLLSEYIKTPSGFFFHHLVCFYLYTMPLVCPPPQYEKKLQLSKKFNSNSSTLQLKSSSSNRFHIKHIKTWFINNLWNYCSTTSLHGFNHITRNDISRGERIFWIAIVIIAIIVSLVLVLVSWFWNRQTPTVTVIESSHFPTWNIPFPAVTICQFNKISKRRATRLAQIL